MNKGILVLIVPLWNWNYIKRVMPWNRHFVLIVPLWNWNDIQRFQKRLRISSNRTFMELKCGHVKRIKICFPVLIVPLWNWNEYGPTTLRPHYHGSNRTFMELKSLCTLSSLVRHWVLIVPLWNWNSGKYWYLVNRTVF